MDAQQPLPFWLGGEESASRRGLWTRAVKLIGGDIYLARLLERLVEADENGHPWVAISLEEMAGDPRWLLCARATAQRTVARGIREGLVACRSAEEGADSGGLRRRRQYAVNWKAIRRIVIPSPSSPTETTSSLTATTSSLTATTMSLWDTAPPVGPASEPAGETPRAGGRAPSFVRRSSVVVVDDVDERTNERWSRAQDLAAKALDTLVPRQSRGDRVVDCQLVPWRPNLETINTLLICAVIVQESVGDDGERSESELVAACSAARTATKSKLNKLKSILGRRLGLGWEGFLARFDVLRVPPDVVSRTLVGVRAREPR
jgi:hypothetical protein